MEPEAVTTLAFTVEQYLKRASALPPAQPLCRGLAVELPAFAKHASRRTCVFVLPRTSNRVTPDDVLLIARTNPSLLDLLNDFVEANDLKPTKTPKDATAKKRKKDEE